MEALAIDPYAPLPPPGQDELPCDDGEPMESPKHRAQMNLLCDTLEAHLEGRPDVFVGGNMGLYYSEIQARNNDFRAPDVFVVLDAIEERERKSWVVWQENGRTPDVVIELLSPSTEREDRGRKMQIYAGLKVAEYYLFDPHDLRLEGYRLEHGAYVPMARRPDGDLDCRALGLRLGVAPGDHRRLPGPWLRWKQTDGSMLLTGDELADQERSRADQERSRAEQERSRADQERSRAERLAERLRALGLNPDE